MWRCPFIYLTALIVICLFLTFVSKDQVIILIFYENHTNIEDPTRYIK